MSGLVDGWETIIDDMVATVKQQTPDYATRTAGFDLGDELLAEGTPLANVTAVARRSRAQFGAKTFVYLNENSYAFTASVSLPAPCCCYGCSTALCILLCSAG